MDRGTRIGRVFKTMTGTCPAELALYSKCVLQHTETLEKGACSKEFEALRKCFGKARGRVTR